MTDEELAGQPGGVATRPDDEPDADGREHVFSPKDFRLNLNTRTVVDEDNPPPDASTLPNLDNPAIRTLTWELVVPDRPASSAPRAATPVPLPPPSRVPPPPVQPSPPLQPPPVVASSTLEAEEVEGDFEGNQGEGHVEDDAVAGDEFAVVEIEAELPEDLSGDGHELVDEAVVSSVVVAAASVAQPLARQVAQQEVNRLALVPDLIDDDSPIELPPITPSGPVVAHVHSVYAPVLAETLHIPPPQRQAVAPVPIQPAETKRKRKSGNKRKGHLLRTFMTLVVLFGLLGGGAFAAKKYLLQPKPEWSAEIKPLADEVARTRDLPFKVSVAVTELPVDQYARRLAGSIIGPGAEPAPTWRALGLLNGELDLDVVGRQAMNDSPAFYDPSTKTIVVADDLKSYEHLYRFALRRALTTALLDQQYDWSTRVASSSPATALGIRSTIDGDALAIANLLAASDAPDQLAPELFSFVQGHGSTPAPSQYAATLAGRSGVAMRPTITSMGNDPVALATLEQSTPGSDGFLNAGRAAPPTAASADTQGMMFWYYVLASRIDDGLAWSAASQWTGDAIATSPSATEGSTSQCVDATVAAADADGAAVLLTALQSWAAAAPAESTTSVSPADGNQVTLRACDPGAALTASIPVKVPVVFGGAGVERALVQAAQSAADGATIDAVCLISAARARGTALSSPADDAPVFAVDWQAAYVTANLDLASGCVPATG